MEDRGRPRSLGNPHFDLDHVGRCAASLMLLRTPPAAARPVTGSLTRSRFPCGGPRAPADLFAAVLDADTGEEIRGYGVDNASVKMGTDGLKLLLQWRGTKDGELVNTTPLAGHRVRVRVYFRDATVFAVGA